MASTSEGLANFPLAGKRVFLHLNRPNQLTAILTKLHADVRPFFDGSVDCVIYNPALRQSPTQSTETVQSTSHLTRGRAMVLAANQGSSTHRDVISQARSLGIHLVTLNGAHYIIPLLAKQFNTHYPCFRTSEVAGWIRDLPERILLAVYNDTGEDELRSDSFDPELDRLLNVRQLKPPAVKVVDRRNLFRPLFAEKTDFIKNLWPCLRALIPSSSQLADRPSLLLRSTTTEGIGDSPSSPAPPSQSFTSTQHKSLSNMITNPPQIDLSAASSAELTSARYFARFSSRPTKSPAQGPNRPTGAHRRSQANPRRRKPDEPHEPSGFCEACCVNYKNLYEHLNSENHMEFANNPENFRGIDDALSSFQGFQQDLLKYMQSLDTQPSTNAETVAQAAVTAADQGEVVPAIPTSDVLPSPPPFTLSVPRNRSPVFDFPAFPPPLTPYVPPGTARFRNLFSDEDSSTTDHAAETAALNALQSERDSAGFERSCLKAPDYPDLISILPVPRTADRHLPSAGQQALALPSSTANILGLLDAPQAQSPRDSSSSTSERIGGRFRSCRECGKFHIPTSINPDLALKMSQFLPGRDIDSFCPTRLSSSNETEPEESMEQNASVFFFPLPRNVQSFEGVDAEQQQSPILNNGVVERSSNNKTLHRSPIFDEENLIQNDQALEVDVCSPPQLLSASAHEICAYPVVAEDSEANSPAEVRIDNTCESDDIESGSSILPPQGSPILNEDGDTLPMVLEQVPVEIPMKYYSDPLISLEGIPVESEAASNSHSYDELAETDRNVTTLGTLSCLKGSLSPEVASLAGPREREEEQERQRFRIPRRAFLVAREAIGLSMQALFTPTKMTSDRAFLRSINMEGNRPAQSDDEETPKLRRRESSSGGVRRNDASSAGKNGITSPVQAIKRRKRLAVYDSSTDPSSDKEADVVVIRKLRRRRRRRRRRMRSCGNGGMRNAGIQSDSTSPIARTRRRQS